MKKLFTFVSVGALGSLLVAPLLFAPRVQATFPGYSGKIIYQSRESGNSEIYIVNPDGSGKTNLTNISASDERPSWSPDGTKIAFQSDRILTNEPDIYTMSDDGSGVTKLTDSTYPEYSPAWSPDGTKIAFFRIISSIRYLYTMNANGSNQTQVTALDGVSGQLRWSPDSTKIAYTASVSGNTDIYTVNIDGTNQTNLTYDTDPYTNHFGPTWSPDSTKIAYTALEWGGNPDIFIMAANGSSQTQITFSNQASYPTWSPDGTKILFKTYAGGTHRFHIIDLDTLDEESLITLSGSGENWSDWQAIPNLTPFTANDTLLTAFNTSSLIDVLANDFDDEPLDLNTLEVTSPPSHGTTVIENNQIRYTPDDGYRGLDELEYQICDTFTVDQKCSTATLAITVQAPDAPIITLNMIEGLQYQDGTATYLSSNTRPVFSGTASPGAEIKIEIHSNPVIFTTVAGGSGSWSASPQSNLPPGVHTVYISATLNGVTTQLTSFQLNIQASLANTGDPIVLPIAIGFLVVGLGVGLLAKVARKQGN